MNLEEFYQATTQLVPVKMDMATDTKLPQYFIQSWQLDYMKSGAYSLKTKVLLNCPWISTYNYQLAILPED